MAGGFTFCGVDCEELGLEYVPENRDTYVYRPSTYEVHEQSFDAHDGGYFYGTTVKSKEFKLRCIYKFTHVNSGIMTNIFQFFPRGRTGKLVFAKRPWVWYNATVTSVDSSQMLNYQNGIITITMKAYYPFGRSDQTYIYDEDPNEESLYANSAMLKGVEWDTRKDFASVQDPITEQKTFLLYNPGTENAKVAIHIAGDIGSGLTIYNKQTGQLCKIVALTKAVTTDVNKHLVVDSMSGKILLTNGATSDYGFFYHDNGFIDLASCWPVIRDVTMQGSAGESTIVTDHIFTQEDIGKYISLYVNRSSALLGAGVLGEIYLGNNAVQDDCYIAKIMSVSSDGYTLNVNKNLPIAVYGKGSVISYNEIEVKPLNQNDEIAITKLAFDFSPTFS